MLCVLVNQGKTQDTCQGNRWHCVFLQHTDSELWSVLDRCHLDRAVRKLGRYLV